MRITSVVFPLLCATALAQAPGAHWSLTTTNANPPQRRENPGAASMTHMYVFGGKSGGAGGTDMNDLWQFDGSTWTEMTADGAVGSPPARDQAGVTWDFANNMLVVFGGDSNGTVLDDVWQWDPNTNTWADVTPATGPSARRFTALSYDPSTGAVLMFGGLDASGTHLNDSWLFAGSAWVQMSPILEPSTRRQHHLVARPDFGDVLLFGGQDASLPAPSKWRIDTWSWVGGQWTQIVTANGPNTQVANDAAYDELRQRVVLAGGNGTGGTPSALINEFDSITNNWVTRPLDPGIYKVSRYFAAYVPTLGKTFKVSGQALNGTTPPANTYEFQSDVVATAVEYGTGCSGPGGALTLVSDSLPWTERTWSATCSNMGANALALSIWGANQSSLPLQPLLPVAGAGCLLLNDALLIAGPSVVVGGQLTVQLPISADPTLSGASLNLQIAELEFGPGFSWIGLYTSNGVSITVGAL